MTRRELLQSALGVVAQAGGDTGLKEAARRIFARINELRILRGSPELRWSEGIAKCAREQSERKRTLRFPGHDDPARGGVAERLNGAGIGWARCAENLFMMSGYDDPVSFAVVFWWYSAGHQANILEPLFTHTGVGVMEGADGAYFVTQIFIEAPRRLARRASG
jgi:uncharacterized protein YkwD